MNILLLLIPAALFLGGLGFAGFIWAMRSGQFDDLEGAGMRILIDNETDSPGEVRSADENDIGGNKHRSR